MARRDRPCIIYARVRHHSAYQCFQTWVDQCPGDAQPLTDR